MAWWPDIETTLLLHLTPSDIVFDIGANTGGYTGLFASIAKRVCAFEPNPALAADLRTTFTQPHVSIHEVALSDTIGEATFYIDTRPNFPAVASSLMELADLKSAGQIRPITVLTSTVDNEVEWLSLVPTFIKIDVEGYEPAVLAGARQTIERYRPKIIFEMWENEWPRYKATFDDLSRTHYLIRAYDGQNAQLYYNNQVANGGVDILALPLAAS